MPPTKRNLTDSGSPTITASFTPAELKDFESFLGTTATNTKQFSLTLKFEKTTSQDGSSASGTSLESSTPPSQGLRAGAIAGITIGISTLIILSLLACLCLWRRRSLRRPKYSGYERVAPTDLQELDGSYPSPAELPTYDELETKARIAALDRVWRPHPLPLPLYTDEGLLRPNGSSAITLSDSPSSVKEVTPEQILGIDKPRILRDIDAHSQGGSSSLSITVAPAIRQESRTIPEQRTAGVVNFLSSDLLEAQTLGSDEENKRPEYISPFRAEFRPNPVIFSHLARRPSNQRGSVSGEERASDLDHSRSATPDTFYKANLPHELKLPTSDEESDSGSRVTDANASSSAGSHFQAFDFGFDFLQDHQAPRAPSNYEWDLSIDHIASACLIDVAGILNRDSCLHQGKDGASIIFDQDQDSHADAGDASATTKSLDGFYGGCDQEDMPLISEMESPPPESTFDEVTELHASSSTSLSSFPSDQDQCEPGPSGTNSKGKGKAKAKAREGPECWLDVKLQEPLQDFMDITTFPATIHYEHPESFHYPKNSSKHVLYPRIPTPGSSSNSSTELDISSNVAGVSNSTPNSSSSQLASSSSSSIQATLTSNVSHPCPDCDQGFRTAGQLRIHYNRQHNLRFRCPDCDTLFGLRADMERHRRSVHKDTYKAKPEEVYTCTNIGCATPEKEFYRKDNFKRHLKRCLNVRTKNQDEDIHEGG